MGQSSEMNIREWARRTRAVANRMLDAASAIEAFFVDVPDRVYRPTADDLISKGVAAPDPLDPQPRAPRPSEMVEVFDEAPPPRAVHHKGLHWTQKPENRALMQRAMRVANRARRRQRKGD